MKVALISVAVVASLLAQTNTSMNLSKELQQDEARTAQKNVQQAAAATAHHSSTKSTGESEVLVINPSDRAKDYKEVYEFLKSQKSAAKVYFTLRNGSTLSNVVDISLPKNGSMLIFRMSTTQGVRYKVVKVEDIVSVEQQ